MNASVAAAYKGIDEDMPRLVEELLKLKLKL